MPSLGYLEQWGATLPSFLCNLYEMVDDSSIDDVISWNKAGTSFIVWRPMEFARDVLPSHFKHNNFSSFVRQLNTYGFRKIALDRWEFSNDYFRRGEKKLLRHIQRRKTKHFAANNEELPTAVSSRKASQDERIMGDNKRLRRENRHLAQELTHLKEMYGSIQLMVSSFAGNPRQHLADRGCTSWTTLTAAKPLKTMIPPLKDESPSGGDDGRSCTDPMDYADPYTMLFGVPIGTKRPRCCEGNHMCPITLLSDHKCAIN